MSIDSRGFRAAWSLGMGLVLGGGGTAGCGSSSPVLGESPPDADAVDVQTIDVSVTQGAGPDATTPRCVPGQSSSCGCTDGKTGAQACSNEGTYGPCVCAGGDASAGNPDDATVPDGSMFDGALSTDAMTTDGECVTLTIGPAGGTLVHPSGAQIVVPVGAVAAATSLSLCESTRRSLGDAGATLGQTFVAGPEGQTFREPVGVAVPFDPTQLPVGSSLSTLRLLMAPNATAGFAALQSSLDLSASLLHASTVHFSQFIPAQTTNPLSITTQSTLGVANVGSSYAVQFAVTGGTPPYAWSVPAGSALPPGLSLTGDGLLSGTPTVPDNYAFFVAASDSAGASVELAFSLSLEPPTNAAPTVTQVAPTSVQQGSGVTIITLTGTGFSPNSQISWDGTSIPTAYGGSSTSLAASIPATYLNNAGAHQIKVSNPPPNGGASSPIYFTVTNPPPPSGTNPVPIVATVTPAQLTTSNTDEQITVTGAQFLPSSVVVIASQGNQGIATMYSSATELVAAVPTTALSTPGTLQIGVFNPAPGGGDSLAAVPVVVNAANPIPTLTSVTPYSAIAGSGSFTMTLTGTGFLPTGQVFFGGTALSTTVTSSTSATASVPASLVSTVVDSQIIFVNPPPGGGPSADFVFAVTTAPSDGGVETIGAAQCSAGFGTGFVPPSGNTSGIGAVPLAVATDASGDLIVVGNFEGSIDFGSAGSIDYDGGDSTFFGEGFLAKLDANCQPVWLTALAGAYVGAATFDKSGNIFVGAASYVAGVSGNAGSTLAKYDPNGHLIWTDSFAPGVFPSQLSLAPDGSIALAGSLDGPWSLGSITLADSPPDGGPPSTDEAYVAKIDASGNVLWAKDFSAGPTSSGQHLTSGVSVDSFGNVIVVGSTSSSIDFGGGTLTPPVGVSFDPFMASFDASGAYRWGRLLPVSSGGNVHIDAIGSDASGNTFITGEINPSTVSQVTTDFGLGPTTTNGYSNFLIDLAATGDAQWADIYPTEWTLTNISVTPAGEIAGIASDGAGGLRVYRFGPDGTLRAQGYYFATPLIFLIVDQAGQLSIAGGFTGTANFGNAPIVASNQAGAAFIARLPP